MRKFIFQVFISIISIYLSAWLYKGFEFGGTLGLVEGAIILAVLIVLIRPIVMVVALPLNLLTFGLLGLIITAWMIQIADLISGSLRIADFWTAIGAAIVLWLIDWLLKRLIPGINKADLAETGLNPKS